MADLPMQPTPPAALYDFDPRMIVDIAYGLEDADNIAARYGLDGDSWKRLKDSIPFQMALAQKVAELRASGYTFRAKCALAAESLLEGLILRAQDQSLGTSTLLEIHRYLAQMGDLLPQKREKEGGASGGGGFVINIHMGSEPQPKVITVEGAPS